MFSHPCFRLHPVCLDSYAWSSLTSCVSDSSGNLYIASSGAIYLVSYASQLTTTLVIGGATGSPTDGTGTSIKFNNIKNLAISSANDYLYVADATSPNVRRVTLPGYVSSMWSQTTGASSAYGIVADLSNSNVYVSHSSSHNVLKVTSSNSGVLYAGSSGRSMFCALVKMFFNPLQVPVGLTTDP